MTGIKEMARCDLEEVEVEIIELVVAGSCSQFPAQQGRLFLGSIRNILWQALLYLQSHSLSVKSPVSHLSSAGR